MGSNIRRDFFQAFLQPTPLTPAQSPPHADEHCQSPNFLCNSAWLERQTSLSIALEVLGEPTALAEDHFPPTPPSENQEDQYLSHPSPSYIEFLSPLPNRSTRTRTVSDHTEYVSSSICLDDNARFRAFSADNSTKIFDGDYTPASSHQSDVNSDSGKTFCCCPFNFVQYFVLHPVFNSTLSFQNFSSQQSNPNNNVDVCTQ